MTHPFDAENIAIQLRDVVSVDGDLACFGDMLVDSIVQVARFASSHKRTFVGMNLTNQLHIEDRFKIAGICGYEFDTTIPDKLCFALIDATTKNNIFEIIDLIWSRMEYGGCIIIKNYSKLERSNVGMEVNNFIRDHRVELTTAHQKTFSGMKTKSLTIKCFPVEKRKRVITDSGSLTIATVLKSGGDFNVAYVNHIADSVKRNSTMPYTFVCLTDLTGKFSPNVHKIIQLRHNLPKWWSKMELFAPNKFTTERILYMDLDTMVVDNIDDILQFSGEFMVLRDFNTQCELASGIIAWKNFNPRTYQIYENFMEAPQSHMNSFNGDQDFIRTVKYINPEYIQDSYPNKIISYKRDCTNNSETSIPTNSSIICFHGKPRPHQINNPIIKQFWLGG